MFLSVARLFLVAATVSLLTACSVTAPQANSQSTLAANAVSSIHSDSSSAVRPFEIAPNSKTQLWTAGWDNFSEPLDYTHSNIVWSANTTTHKLTITFKLVNATPNKLYQVGVHIFCTNAPGRFGQFPTDPSSGACSPLTRQGVSALIASVEMGVVTTDVNGTGSFHVVVGPIKAGTYTLEFDARNGAGCNVAGGGPSDSVHCEIDFQSPGPIFGDTITFSV